MSIKDPLSSSLEIKFNHINDKKYNRLLSRFKNGQEEYVKISL